MSSTADRSVLLPTSRLSRTHRGMAPAHRRSGHPFFGVHPNVVGRSDHRCRGCFLVVRTPLFGGASTVRALVSRRGASSLRSLPGQLVGRADAPRSAPGVAPSRTGWLGRSNAPPPPGSACRAGFGSGARGGRGGSGSATGRGHFHRVWGPCEPCRRRRSRLRPAPGGFPHRYNRNRPLLGACSCRRRWHSRGGPSRS